MQTSITTLVNAFILAGFLTCGIVHGQTCESEIKRCSSLTESVDPSAGIDALCGTGGTFKTCINMLGQYCTSKEEKKAAEALTRYINYLCTDQGQTDVLEFAKCSASGPCSQAYGNNVQKSGLCSAGGVYRKCITSSCNSRAVRFVDHLLSLVNIAGNCGNGGSAGRYQLQSGKITLLPVVLFAIFLVKAVKGED